MKETITRISIALFIVSLLLAITVIGAKYEVKKSEQFWNNGICTECGGNYHLVAVTKNSTVDHSKEYTYECKNCFHTIVTNYRMK